MPGTFDGPLDLSLTACTIAAALPRVYLAAIGQKSLQCINVFVVDVFVSSSAEAALCLFAAKSCSCSTFCCFHFYRLVTLQKPVKFLLMHHTISIRYSAGRRIKMVYHLRGHSEHPVVPADLPRHSPVQPEPYSHLPAERRETGNSLP